QVDALEHLQGAEPLVDLLDPDQVLVRWAHACPPQAPPCPRARPRSRTRARLVESRPRANRRSMKYWPIMSRLVRARYHRHAPTNMGNSLKVRAPIAWVWNHSSLVTGTYATSAVSFSMAMVSLPVGGMMGRIAWGMTIRHRVWPRVSPSAAAASVCPRSTDRMPARTISAM